MEIYFDNNATTMIDPVVARRMADLHDQRLANPASQHAAGRRALQVLEEATETILQMVDAPPSSRVVYTSGGTEANNLAIMGTFRSRPGMIFLGGVEHPSVVEAATAVAGSENVRLLPVDEHGQCDLDTLERWFRQVAGNNQRVSLVSVMRGNNETGILQDLRPIAELCQRYDTPFHSDVIQVVGKIPFSMADAGLNAISITAHKIHGPIGIGALILDGSMSPTPLLVGGGQQLGLRPGTIPVVLAAALAETLRQICADRDEGVFDRLQTLRDVFERRVGQIATTYVIGQDAPRLPHTSNIAFLGLDRQALHMALDLNGLACSTGSACASGSARPSPVLTAMGLPPEVVSGSLRFSLSRFTQEDEVDRALEIIARAVEKASARPTLHG
ncbi:MAG: cysteine desulfurase [Planctomycetota bacterium]|nr:MAG: cysteine desulfurase [Planctomycetota bacterium]